jgi:predicted Zn-dependent protease
MPYFLEKLERSESNTYGDLTKYLYTHPMSIDRLSDTRSLVAQMPKRKAADDLNYVLAREKLRILSGQNAAPLSASSLNAVASAYGKAYQALRAGNANAAASIPANNPASALLQAQAFNAAKRYLEAEKRLQSFSNQVNTQAAFNITLAESQLGQNKAAVAMQTLSRLRLAETTGLEYFEDAQRLAQQANQPAEASFYSASRSLRLGEYAHAVATAQQALKSANASAVTLRNLRNLQNEAERQLLNTAQR